MTKGFPTELVKVPAEFFKKQKLLSIEEKYATLGGSSGFLGKAIFPENIGAKNGKFQMYEHGYIFWHPSIGAHEVHGDIQIKYFNLGREFGFLGYPTTDELQAPDGKGRYSMFQGGVILWTLSIGAYEVHGAILEKYKQEGAYTSGLGYPTSDELPIPDSDGKMSAFENGIIEWFPKTGTAIRKPNIIDLAVVDWRWKKDEPYIWFYAVVENQGDVIGLKTDPFKGKGHVRFEWEHYKYHYFPDVQLPEIPDSGSYPYGEPVPWRPKEKRCVPVHADLFQGPEDAKGMHPYYPFKFLYACVFAEGDKTPNNDSRWFWSFPKEVSEIYADEAHKK
jgi:hypothetical protein